PMYGDIIYALRNAADLLRHATDYRRMPKPTYVTAHEFEGVAKIDFVLKDCSEVEWWAWWMETEISDNGASYGIEFEWDDTTFRVYAPKPQTVNLVKAVKAYVPPF